MNALDFFTGRPNTDGRTLDAILAEDDDALEFHHDIIQWCFPLHEPSSVNPDAPIISPAEQQTLSGRPDVRRKMRQVLDRWLSFYGFRFQGPSVVPTDDFADKSQHWNRPLNHNHLRITRIIRSLRLFGLDDEARQVHDAFATFAGSNASRIAPTAPAYWRDALHGDLFAPITGRPRHT